MLNGVSIGRFWIALTTTCGLAFVLLRNVPLPDATNLWLSFLHPIKWMWSLITLEDIGSLPDHSMLMMFPFLCGCVVCVVIVLIIFFFMLALWHWAIYGSFEIPEPPDWMRP